MYPAAKYMSGKSRWLAAPVMKSLFVCGTMGLMHRKLKEKCGSKVTSLFPSFQVAFYKSRIIQGIMNGDAILCNSSSAVNNCSVNVGTNTFVVNAIAKTRHDVLEYISVKIDDLS